MMDVFFEKYKVKLDEGDALGVMHEQIHAIKKAYKEDKESKKYLNKLAELHCQIEDFFEAKGIDMSDI